MSAQSGKLRPILAAIGRAKERSVFHSRKDHVRIGQRWLEMPHSLELPRVRGAVVPLMRSGHTFVGKVVTHWRPRHAAVLRALNDLAEPAARLRRIEAVGIRGRSCHVKDFPACKVWPAHLPAFSRVVRRQHECTFPRANENSYCAHLLPPSWSVTG